MEQPILDNALVIWRWGVPIAVAVTIIAILTLIAAARSRRLGQRGLLRWSLYVVCVGIALGGLAALFLRLGPLAPFVQTAGGLAALEGRPLEAATLTRVTDGSAIDLAEFRGRVVVVNLWGTWCPPCRAEMPDLIRLASDDPARVVVVTVSDEDRVTQQRFAELVGLPPDAAVGSIGLDSSTFRPFTILLDQSGVVREFHFGAKDYDFFRQRVEEYL